MKKILTVFITISLLVSCGGSTKPKFVQDLEPGVHKVKLMEVLQTNNYTYLLVREGGEDQWLAVPSMDAVVGKFYYYKGGMEMPNFTSKELNREFESVLFLEKVSDSPDLEAKQDIPATTHSAMVKKDSKMNLEIDPAEGGLTISDLFANKEKYEGKTVTIKGQVTKFNAQIMGKNWIHLQDGTDYQGLFDLTVTSASDVEVGAIISVEGVVALNRDFGYGYTYDIIVEEAKVLK